MTHAAGISSTGDVALDERLPFDEPYSIPRGTAKLVQQAHANGNKIIAIGTSVVRALESSAEADGSVQAGRALARNRIGPDSNLQIVDSILTGMHQPGESHFELLRAFVDEPALNRIHQRAIRHGYRAHEFGDFLLLHRQRRNSSRISGTPARAARVLAL